MSNPKKIVSTFLLALLFFAGCFGVVFESHKYGYLYGIVPFVLVFLPFIVLCGLWFDLKGRTRLIEWKKTLVIIFILGGLYWALTVMKTRYLNYQLENHSVTVNALVVGYTKSTTRGTTYHYAVFAYQCGHKDYLQKINNDNDFFRIGDSINMTCSYNDPEIFRILTVKHPYQKILYRFKY